MIKIKNIALFLVLLMVFTGCNTTQNSVKKSEPVQQEQISDVEEITDSSQEETLKLDKNSNKQNENIIKDINNDDKDNDKENEKDKEKRSNTIHDIEEAKEVIQNNSVNSKSNLSNEQLNWYSGRRSNHIAPSGNQAIDISKYYGFYVGNTEEKVIYLTFDNGYENGFTSKILDTLKKHDVKATFFVTLPFIKNNINLVKRMKEEGHCVGNHTSTHPSLPTISDEQIKDEILKTEGFMKENTGYSIDPFFRPPAGAYSERTLDLTQKLGYATIFWSLAFKDWDINNQPGAKYSYDYVMENYHPGAIPLLHAVSSSNTEALDDILTSLEDKGYRFASLYELIDNQQNDKENQFDAIDDVSTTESNIKEIINNDKEILQ